MGPTDDQDYMLVSDNDAHWYVIPASCERDWEDFREIPEDDERSWDVPTYAAAIGGSPSLLKFKQPRIKR
jgi:hypothetical protein